jgi:hypothetical protein
MKRLKFLLLISLLCFSIYTEAQWNNVYNKVIYNPMILSNVEIGIIDIDFISESSGIFNCHYWFSPSEGMETELKITNNSCNSWYSYAGFNEYQESYKIYAVKNQLTYFHLINVLGFHSLFGSTNYGVSWNLITEGTGRWQDISASNVENIYILTQKNGIFYIDKRINGIMYNKIDSFINQKSYLMVFPDTTTGYIAAATTNNPNCHLILKSISSGTNWFTVFSDSLMNIRKMFFTSTNIGYAVGDSGKIIKTIDGGLNWQHLNSNLNYNLYSVYFINDTLGFAAGDSGVIIKTINGGTSWNQQSTNTNLTFSKILFVNNSIGFAIAGSYIYKSNQNNSSNIWEVFQNKENDFLPFPNPGNGIFYLNTDGIIMNIEIENIFGELVFSSSSTIDKTEINLSAFPNGIYFIRLFQENRLIKTHKLILIK